MADTWWISKSLKKLEIKKVQIAVSLTESINTLHRNYSATGASLYLLPRKDI